MAPDSGPTADAYQAAAHLAAIVEASQDAIISKTLQGVVLTWNAAAERIYGYSAAEARGRAMTFLLPPDLPDEEAGILEQIRHGARVEHFETVRQRKDGRRISVSLTISPIRDETGGVVGASHTARDITERKSAEARLRDSEARLRAFLESASQGIVTIDVHGCIEIANAKAEELFGYSREELTGKLLEDLVPEFRLARPGVDLSGTRRDGTAFPLEIALSYIPSDGGQLAIAFINDITERRRIEQQLRQTQKLESLGVLAGGVAHDFNNLLTGILGNTSLALEMLSTSHPARVALRQALSASERAADLTKQLLAYAGKGRFVIEPLDLSGLIREIAGLIQTSMPKTVQLRLDLAGDLPFIEADSSQLQQLIMNLVINGAEAIGEERTGTVLVTTGVQEVDEAYLRTTSIREDIPTGAYVTLEIHDTGSGMDPTTLSRIFDPFFTTKFTGRGLGLAAAQGIVRSHKGALKVYSQPGKGSTFKVLFPASVHRPAERRHQGAEALAGTGTVLVVDDEPIVRQTAKAMLERFGYTALLAENGKEAVDLFRIAGEKISLVVLDMTMPVMSGEETLRELKVIRPEIRVILSSGYNEVEAIRRFTGKGLAGFIQKPYSAVDLAKKVKAALDGAIL